MLLLLSHIMRSEGGGGGTAAPTAPAPAAPAAPNASAQPVAAQQSAPAFDHAWFNTQFAMQPLQGLPEGAIDGKTLEQYNQRKLTYDKNVAWRDGLLKEALAPLKVGDIEIPIAPQEAKEFLEFLRSSGQLGHNVDVARLRQGFFSNKLIAAAQERGSSKSKASVNDALEARRMDQPNPNPAVKASQSTKTEKVFDKNAEFGMKDPNGHNMKLIDHFRSEGLDPEAFVSELHRRSDDAR